MSLILPVVVSGPQYTATVASADLVVFDKDPLTTPAAQAVEITVRQTWVNGVRVIG